MYPARSSSCRYCPCLLCRFWPGPWWCSSSPPARTASWRATLWISATAPRCAGGGWTSRCNHGFFQCEIPPSYHLLSAVWKSACFRGKYGLYTAGIPRRGKPMGGGLLTDYERENTGFSTPFGVVFHTIDVSIMAIHREQRVRDKFWFKKSHRTKSYGSFSQSKETLF